MSSIHSNEPKESQNVEQLSASCGKSTSSGPSIIASSADVSSIESFPVYHPDPNLSVPELKKKLCVSIKSRPTDIIKAFVLRTMVKLTFIQKLPFLLKACRNYDRKLTGEISKSQLKQVLRTFCIPLTAAQFEAIIGAVKENEKGKINYLEFIKLRSGKNISLDPTIDCVPENLPVDELELRIRSKIKPYLRDIVRSFWLFDYNKDGYIQKKELKKIFENYCFKINESLYNELWKRYDPQSIGIINYKDFLVKLGISVDRYKKYMPRETVAQALSWIENSAEDFSNALRYEQRKRRAAIENRDDPIIHGLPIEEAEDLFLKKLRRSGTLLKQAFKMFDSEDSGQIAVNDFHGVLNFFIMPMSTGTFNELIGRLNVKIPPTRKINWQYFVEMFCKPQPDVQHMDAMEFNKFEKCMGVIKRIKNHVLKPEARLKSVFTNMGKDNHWQVTRQELRKAIEKALDFTLTDDEFKELTMILDPGHSNLIDCKEFISLFESGVSSDVMARKAGVSMMERSGLAPSSLGEKYKNLKNKNLKSKLKYHVNKNLKNIEQALLACDLDQSGLIGPKKLRDILDNFCFSLTNEQFAEIMANFTVFRDKMNYYDFLEVYKKTPDEDTNKWIEIVEKLTPYKSKCSTSLPVEETEEMLRECVRSKTKGLLKDFKTLDICKVGIAYKDDVRRLFNKYALRMNDHQFNSLWKDFPLNNFGQLMYEEFLEDYSKPGMKIQGQSSCDIDPVAVKTPESMDRELPVPESVSNKELNESENKSPEQIQNKLLPSYIEEEKLNRRKDVLDSVSKQRRVHRTVSKKNWGKTASGNDALKKVIINDAPHLENTFASMKIPILTNFRAIRHRFRRTDPKITGLVDFVTFQTILRQSGVYLNDEEKFHVLEYFDPKLTGKINYRDFLRVFVWYA